MVVATRFTDGHLVGTELSARALLDGELLGLHTTSAGWPEGVMLRPLLWPVVLLSLLIGSVAALNLTWALTPLLGAAGGWVLARVLGASPWGAVLTGALLAWTPWVRLTLANGQIEQATLGLIALVWAAAVWGERGHRARTLLSPALLLGSGLAAPHTALAASLGLGALGVCRGWRGAWARWAVVLGLGMAAMGVCHAYHAQNFADEANLFRPRHTLVAPDPGQRQNTVTGWHATHTSQLSYATPEALMVPIGPGAYELPTQHSPYLGGVVMLAGLGGLLLGWRRTWPLGVAAVALVGFSMAPRVSVAGQDFLMPGWLLEAISPAAQRSASGYRLAMGAIVALAAAAGAGLFPTGRTRRVPLVVVGLWALAWLETSLLPGHPLPLTAYPAVAHPELAVLGEVSGPVLDLPLPLHWDCQRRPPHYLNAALVHPLPFLHNVDHGAYFFGNQDAVLALNRVLESPDCAQGVKPALQALGLGAVVLHHDLPCAASEILETCLQDGLGDPQTSEWLSWWVLPAGGSGR